MSKNPQKPGSAEPWGDKGSKATSPNTDNKHDPSGKPESESAPAPKDHGTKAPPK